MRQVRRACGNSTRQREKYSLQAHVVAKQVRHEGEEDVACIVEVVLSCNQVAVKRDPCIVAEHQVLAQVLYKKHLRVYLLHVT